ncbi:rab11 family-interacting 4A [Labeo rohita]|uniref:Rab11 family-interacting 4A n=1 Tax=Labeo rohita TaxID=84645 RepID=A0A498NM92_LABRO|nr:rab11 family-interacting 4A [Labeo rohita]RXN33092.1 rab11 family-interacting 4A [Labeo rohita]
MDGNVFPDQEQLLVFLKKLKEVFDVCDEDADGYIRVEHFVDLGLQFGQGDEVKKFAKYLDPNAHGRINFKDFCHGVFAIKGCEEILKTALGTPNISAQPYQTDNGYYYQIVGLLSCEDVQMNSVPSTALLFALSVLCCKWFY